MCKSCFKIRNQIFTPKMGHFGLSQLKFKLKIPTKEKIIYKRPLTQPKSFWKGIASKIGVKQFIFVLKQRFLSVFLASFSVNLD